MVSVIGSAILFVVVAALCSMAFSRYANFRKHRQARRAAASGAANADFRPVSTTPLDAENTDEPSTMTQAESRIQQFLPPGVSTPQAAAPPETSSPTMNEGRTHRRSRHLISYTDDSDDEDGAGAANGLSWKRFFLPVRHIALRRMDPEGAVSDGYRLDSLSVSPSKPVVFGGGDEKDGGDRASMCVVLTPPSPEVRTPLSRDDGIIEEHIRVEVEKQVKQEAAKTTFTFVQADRGDDNKFNG